GNDGSGRNGGGGGQDERVARAEQIVQGRLDVGSQWLELRHVVGARELVHDELNRRGGLVGRGTGARAGELQDEHAADRRERIEVVSVAERQHLHRALAKDRRAVADHAGRGGRAVNDGKGAVGEQVVGRQQWRG